jgi:hypothetical protein
MPRGKKHSPEEVIPKLRKAEVSTFLAEPGLETHHRIMASEKSGRAFYVSVEGCRRLIIVYGNGDHFVLNHGIGRIGGHRSLVGINCGTGEIIGENDRGPARGAEE